MRERRRAALATALAVVVALVVWRAVGGEPVAPPRAGATGGIETSVVRDTGAAAAAAVLARETVAGEGAVFGTATDAAGAPLTGWLIDLWPRRPEGEPARMRAVPGGSGVEACVGVDGAFAFDGIEPGDYALTVRDGDEPVEFALAAGERRRVDLRLGTCAVTVELRRGGERLRGCHVFVDFADASTRSAVGSDDLWRIPVPPGVHVLVVGGQKSLPLTLAGAGKPRRSRPTIAKLPFTVPVGRASLHLVVEVPRASLEVVASGAAGPIPLLRFRAEGGPGSRLQAVTEEVVAADGRSATFPELPPGTWIVRAESPWFEAEPQTVQIPQGTATHRLVLDGRRLAVVRLDLRTPAGRPLRVRAAVRQNADRLPPLRATGREVACGDVATVLVPRRDGVVLGFAGVPLGGAEWGIADDEVDGAVRFAMFDPVPTQRLDVLGVGDEALTVCVQPRAFVELVGCRANGMESPFARVRVFAGERPVAGFAAETVSRWQGFLPPGEYRVEIDDDERASRRTHGLIVQRRDLTLRLRP